VTRSDWLDYLVFAAAVLTLGAMAVIAIWRFFR
jgi:hypothetical protein